MKNKLISRDESKIKIYKSDPYYRDCYDDISNYFDDNILQKLHNITTVILRPDSIITRHAFNILERILSHGYTPIYITPFEYCRYKVRECWKYQLNIATRDRIEVMDMILIGFPCIYIVFYKDFSDSDISATNYLSQLKGPSLPEGRKEGNLRFSTESAQVSVLTYLHVSDEPVDIIREMGAFFDKDQRCQIIDSIINAKPIDSLELLEKITEGSEYHTLKYKDVRCKVEDSCLEDIAKDQLIDAFNKLERKEITWREMKTLMEDYPLTFNYWDIVSVCAQFAETHHQNIKPIVEDTI